MDVEKRYLEWATLIFTDDAQGLFDACCDLEEWLMKGGSMPAKAELSRGSLLRVLWFHMERASSRIEHSIK